jgi:microcin C transport system substrate-binding protein
LKDISRMAQLSRRHVLGLGLGALTAAQSRRAFAEDFGPEAHGMSAFGDLKYAPDFHHFDYVNADAPKGGMFSQLVGSGGSTFNSLNAYIVKGDRANGMELTFASLMARALDEPDAVYPWAAEELTVSPDGLAFRFRLRPGTVFHDGSEIAASDVAFSLTTLKSKGHPSFSSVLRDLAEVAVEDKRTVLLRFLPTRGLDVPALAAAMPIFSEKYYSTRSFDETSLEAPLGSGPYRVARFEQGRFVEFERVRNWWGEKLPVSRGQYNFDTLRDEYYRDREAGFEAFTGRNYLFREEFTSRVWATRYDFPALRDGRVKRDVIADERPSGAQGWLLNTRRDKFNDRRVREALTIAFDFEWTNRNLMYGSYQRTHSVFQNSEMMARGEPSPDEVALLEPFRDRLLPEVFGPAWIPPETDGSGQDRKLLRGAGELLNAAGWTIKEGRRLNAKGEQLSAEFLLTERSFEPHHTTFIKNLRVLGIDANIRLVDPAQAEVRLKDFDFDIAIARFIFPQIPGSSLRNYFSSDFANTKGSSNLAGIADPVVDALVEKAVGAQTQATLNNTCRALDRVLRSGRYWIPHWNKASFWIAYWDQFGFPPTKPRYARGAPETWWYEPVKAAKIEQAK